MKTLLQRIGASVVLGSGGIGFTLAMHAVTECSYCKCANETGVIVANQVGPGQFEFNKAFWYYERRTDGSSGGPIANAAVRLHYVEPGQGQPPLDCIANEQSRLTGLTINRYEVTVPDPLPCTASNPGLGHNMLYRAAATAPTPEDAHYVSGPTVWNQRECVPPGS